MYNFKNKISKILFLGYGENETILIEELRKKNIECIHENKKIFDANDFDLVISFGYRHIIDKKILYESSATFINLHMSYLPWNKGAHPNFWSFYDSTPIGITIHSIDPGIDTGPIIFQKYINFEVDEITFKKTYDRLKKELEKLFIQNMEKILSLDFPMCKQTIKGTFHKKDDLPKEFRGWDMNIDEEITRLHEIQKIRN